MNIQRKYNVYKLHLVLKLERFNFSNDEQPLNICPISATLLVLKLERFNSFNDEQPSIEHIFHISHIISIKIRKV